MREAWQSAGCEWTRPAVNWPAWCGRLLLIEIHTEVIKATLPVRLRHTQRMDLGHLVEWAADDCEIRGAQEWVPEFGEDEVVLRPLHQYYDRTRNRKSEVELDTTVALRVGPQLGLQPSEPVARVPEPEGEPAESLRKLTGQVVRLGIHPGYPTAIHEVLSLPPRIQAVELDETRVALRGGQGMGLEVRGRLVNLRVMPGYWLVDIWHEKAGYLPSFRVHGRTATVRKKETVPSVPSVRPTVQVGFPSPGQPAVLPARGWREAQMRLPL